MKKKKKNGATSKTAAEVPPSETKTVTLSRCANPDCPNPPFPSRSNRKTCCAACRKAVSRATPKNQALNKDEKEAVKIARRKQKASPEAVALIDAYFKAMRRDTADSLYGGTVNISTRDFKHDESLGFSLVIAPTVVKKNDSLSDADLKTVVVIHGRFGEAPSKTRSPKISYGVYKPTVADFEKVAPLYTFIHDEKLKAKYKAKHEKKPRVPRPFSPQPKRKKKPTKGFIVLRSPSGEVIIPKNADLSDVLVLSEAIGGGSRFVSSDLTSGKRESVTDKKLKPLVGGVLAVGGTKPIVGLARFVVVKPIVGKSGRASTHSIGVDGICVEAPRVAVTPTTLDLKSRRDCPDDCDCKRCTEFRKFRKAEALKEREF